MRAAIALTLLIVCMILASCGEDDSVQAPVTELGGLYRVYAWPTENTCAEVRLPEAGVDGGRETVVCGYLTRVDIGENNCTMFGMRGGWDPNTRTAFFSTDSTSVTLTFPDPLYFTGQCAQQRPANRCATDWELVGVKVTH